MLEEHSDQKKCQSHQYTCNPRSDIGCNKPGIQQNNSDEMGERSWKTRFSFVQICSKGASAATTNGVKSRQMGKVCWSTLSALPSKFFTFVHHSFNTRGHGLKLTRKLYPTNALANTFANRCINCWNALPSSTVSSPTLSHFKLQLKKLTYPTIVWADVRGEITLSVHSKWFIFWSPTPQCLYIECIYIFFFWVSMSVLYIVNCDHVWI